MPPKSKLLPYLRIGRSGKLEYYRRLPKELRPFFGNRGAITSVLPLTVDAIKKAKGKAVYAKFHQGVEAQLAAARQQCAESSAEKVTRTPIAPRAAAAIAAEPWRSQLAAADRGSVPEGAEEKLVQLAYTALLALSVAETEGTGALIQGKAATAALLIKPILESLHINPDTQGYEQIFKRMPQYLQMIKGDLQKREEGDFSTPEIESKAPPLPKSQVTYEQLMEQWLLDAGGLSNEVGVGVSEDRVKAYQRAIDMLIGFSGKHFPAELTLEDARGFVQHLQKSDLAPSSKQSKLGTISNLFKIAKRFALLDENVFADMRIKIPKGAEADGYRPFTRRELITIFDDLSRLHSNERSDIPLILLCTGARVSDITCLRHSDLKQSKNGVYYFDMQHVPVGEFPHPLKGGKTDERHTPLHPILIERGIPELFKESSVGYIFENSTTRKSDLLSNWFQRILRRLEIYERGVGLHSLRGTFIDAMRTARIPEDARRAMTAHSSRDVQDRRYGDGLPFMPDILHEEICKIDFSWLP